eukprot:5641727-Pyramimonas_sp.AAC.1
MASPLIPGLSLPRHNTAGAWLRLKRSCWLGLPAPFQTWWRSWLMVVISSSTPHHPRHYLVDYGYGGTSGCSGFERRNVYNYAVPQGNLQRYLCPSGSLSLTSYVPALLHS